MGTKTMKCCAVTAGSLLCIATSCMALNLNVESASAAEDADLKVEFLAICDEGIPILQAQAQATERSGRAFYWDSYLVRGLCVAYDMTGHEAYLDACRQWSQRMLEYQRQMIPAGAYYMQYGRKPGEDTGAWFVADCASIALGVLATSVRCTDPKEKREYLDSVRAYADLVADRWVRPSGGVTDGYWPKSDDEWWCSTGIFGSLAFCLYNETKDARYLQIGLGTIDWLNRQDLLAPVEFFPPGEITPTVLMYCLEAYSSAYPHLEPGSTRQRAALQQLAKVLQWIKDNGAGRSKIEYASQWGSKFGGLPFHLYAWNAAVPDHAVVSTADEQLRHIATVLNQTPASNQRDQLALFAVMSYAERLQPGSIYRSSRR